ncbi:DUF4436 family protein [Brevibacterium casei]
MDASTKRPRSQRFVWIGAAALTLICIALIVWVNAAANSGTEEVTEAGSDASPDRVEVTASVQKVDAATGELQLRLQVSPQGALTSDGGLSPVEDLEILSSKSVKDDLTFKAYKRISSVDTLVSIDGSAITAYPFDGYQTDIEFGARMGGENVPVHVVLTNRDSLFSVYGDGLDENGVALMELAMARSIGVSAFAVFMALAMWALCIAVIIGTRFIITQRKGLVWPALGWMAASLFALAAFRNAAPGNPPIGSIIDYVAFFWAEVTIASCILITVIGGQRAESRALRDADAL